MKLNYWYLRRANIFFALAEMRGIIDRIAAAPDVVPNPRPSIPEMEAAWTEVYDLAQKSKSGDRNFIRFRQERFEILLQMLVQQMGTVTSVCTETQAQALGFRLGYKKGSGYAPVAPSEVKAEPAFINNSIKVSWRRSSCPGAFGFTIEMTQDNPLETEARWKSVPSFQFTSRGTMTIPHLNNLQRYWFRVQAHYRSGVSPYSQPVPGVAL